MELFDHQKKIIADAPLRCGFWLGTGGGKTRLMAELAEGRTIVLSPKQQKVDGNFEKTVGKFGLVLNVETYSKEQFKKIWETLGPCDTLIVDECDEFLGILPQTRKRNKVSVPKTSQIFEALYKYIGVHAPKRIYLASATPAPKPLAVWGIAYLLGKTEVLGEYKGYFEFRDRFYIERQMGAFKVWVDKKDIRSKTELTDMLKQLGYTGRLEDWFDVPDQVHKEIYVELTAEQKTALDLIKEVEADPMVRKAKQRTIENGLLYDQEVQILNGKEERITKAVVQYKTEKTALIEKFAQEFEKVLIFANYTAQIENIVNTLSKQGYNVVSLTGKTKKEDRKIMFGEAEKKPTVIVAQSNISSGYEWKTCQCVIFASKSNRYTKYLQALGRPLRADALKKNLFIHLIVKGGTDEACHKTILSGQDFNEKLYGQVEEEQITDEAMAEKSSY